MVIGPEVIEETRNSVVIQDLSDTAELSAEKCLRRMHLIVRAMHEDAIEALRTQDEALARDVAQRDQDVDRLYWMVAKQYNVAHTTGGTANGAKGRNSSLSRPSWTASLGARIMPQTSPKSRSTAPSSRVRNLHRPTENTNQGFVPHG